MKIATNRSVDSALLVGLGIVVTIVGASMLGFAQPANPPRVNQVQYAVLTKFGNDASLPCRSVTFDFADRNNHYAGDNLRALLKSRTPVAGDDAAIVNAISDLGWELVSHSQAAATTNPAINNGNTSGNSEVFVNETWWFKRR